MASAKEVWVTTPRDQSIAVLDASKPDTLTPKTTIKFDGNPEGFAVDATRGLFFTNLEDKNKTVVVDIKTHKATAAWNVDCGQEGPRGVATDEARGFVFVACTERVWVLDGSKEGGKLGMLETGAGVDNIDWSPSKGLLCVAAGKAAALTEAHVDDKGQPVVVAKGASVPGARNAVLDAQGTAYVADPNGARILAFRAGQ